MSRQHANEFYVHAHSMHSVVCIQGFGQTNIDQDLIVRVRFCTVGVGDGRTQGAKHTTQAHPTHIQHTTQRRAAAAAAARAE